MSETIDHPQDKSVVLDMLVERLVGIQEKEIKHKRNKFWILTSLFVFVFLLYIGVFYKAFNPGGNKVQGDAEKGYVSMVRISGEISAENGVSSMYVSRLLEKAFEDEDAKGVAILINSPGGSPVQSSNIYESIMRLKKEHRKKVIAIGEDYLTSGAYFIASGADSIFVNKSTITGSIGVIMQTFGLNDVIDRIGVTNRLFTAGTAKGRFDQYSPLREDDRAKADSILTSMHSHFIDSVMATRGDKLTKAPDEVFTGDFWTGEQALKLGLVDGVSDPLSVIEQEFGVTAYRDYTRNSPFRDFLRTLKSAVEPFMATGIPEFR